MIQRQPSRVGETPPLEIQMKKDNPMFMDWLQVAKDAILEGHRKDDAIALAVSQYGLNPAQEQELRDHLMHHGVL